MHSGRRSADEQGDSQEAALQVAGGEAAEADRPGHVPELGVRHLSGRGDRVESRPAIAAAGRDRRDTASGERTVRY